MNAAGEPHERRETVDTRETTRRLVTYHRYSRTIDASLYHRGDPVRPFPVPTARLRRGTVHERLLSLELARTGRSGRDVLGSEDVFDPLVAGEASLELIGVSASGWKNPAPSLVKVTPHTVGTLSAPRAVLLRAPSTPARAAGGAPPAKYLSQKSMEKRTR